MLAPSPDRAGLGFDAGLAGGDHGVGRRHAGEAVLERKRRLLGIMLFIESRLM